MSSPSTSVFRYHAQGVSFAVRLTPKGGRDAVEGWHRGSDGRPHLKVRVSVPPANDLANEALITLMAKMLGVAKSRVRIASGRQGRMKMLDIEGDGTLLAARLVAITESL